MKQIFIQIFTDLALTEQLDHFMEKYEFHQMISCPEKPNKIWKPRSERVCRFCKKGNTETSFRTDAHHVPEFLGNKYLIFQEECDQCNAKFSDYESHLSAYLGVGLTIYSLKGKKNKIPKFRANDGLTAQQQQVYGTKAIVMEKEGENVAKMDFETGKCEIEFTKQSYIPLKAYKALLKIAVTSFTDGDIKYYDMLIRSLTSNEFDDELSLTATIKEYWLPIKYESPRVYIFKAKAPTVSLPEHICMLYFGYQAFQFVVPDSFKSPNNNILISQPYIPPFYHFQIDSFKVFENFTDLSSKEKITGEKGFFHFEADPEILKNLTTYDSVSKKFIDKKFDTNKIVKLIIGELGDNIDLS